MIPASLRTSRPAVLTVQVVAALFLLVALQTLFSVPRLSWELATGDGGRTGIVLGFAIAAVAAVLVWRTRERCRRLLAWTAGRLERIPRGLWILGVLFLGIALRIL